MTKNKPKMSLEEMTIWVGYATCILTYIKSKHPDVFTEALNNVSKFLDMEASHEPKQS